MSIRSVRVPIIVTVFAMFLAATSTAFAGWYGWDPSVPREHRPGNVYFGSAKSVDGRFLSGVTVVLVTSKVDFVTVTGPTGRFRLEVPTELRHADITPRCSRNGYTVTRLDRRLPRGTESSPVQVDCVLLKDASP